MTRSIKEIEARCSCILGDERTISLVEASSSPTSTYEMVFKETEDVEKAKAGRWAD